MKATHGKVSEVVQNEHEELFEVLNEVKRKKEEADKLEKETVEAGLIVESIEVGEDVLEAQSSAVKNPATVVAADKSGSPVENQEVDENQKSNKKSNPVPDL